MTTPAQEPERGVALVPGELRGYRQFELRADGLYPLVHSGAGPWDGTLERARCVLGAEHAPPSADCRCGLYAWYLPGTETVPIGPAHAVIAARGRCVLGDRGFRAAQARIEAIALPATVRWHPRAASTARAMLASTYPHTRVYRSARQMWRDHPPPDVGTLGIRPPVDRTRGYRKAAAATYATGLLLTLAISAMPLLVVAHGSDWLLLLVLFVMAWQAALVWLIAQLAKAQVPRRPPQEGRRR
jgi:hypothetical protein